MISIYKSRYSAIILFAICLIMEIPLWAQQKAIQGTVKDIEGNPMPGVTIMVDGTNIGTITNTDGKYSINIPEKRKSLTFSFFRLYFSDARYSRTTDNQRRLERRFNENRRSSSNWLWATKKI